MKRKTVIAAILLQMVLLAAGCGFMEQTTAQTTAAPATEGASEQPSETKQSGNYQKITAEEAFAMLQDPQEDILLDVRTKEEFDAGHIAGALLLPDYEVAQKAESVLPDRGARILVYCRSGRRSAEAAKQLIVMGYTSVYDFGGVIDWPYGTVTAESAKG
ncbi:MAG: rhodanese-like domain-containing protein [Oscillospiraceae bacterium]|jgi:rhodanese-related sulfurtransferase|nr:rhodanese-like domain-containing protein [Oscillospiraceae bacterium]